MAVSLSVLGAYSALLARKIRSTNICQSSNQLLGISAAGRIGTIEKSTVLILNRTRDLPAYNIALQPNTLEPAFCIKH
jgi:hypothetical protein